MSDDAIVPEEWVEAGRKAAFTNVRVTLGQTVQRRIISAALAAVVPLAEQRATRSLLKAREETEGR